MTAPVIFTWTDDGVMRPLARFNALCDRQFVIGENYRLEVVEERSPQSHKHYFACVNEAWQNLPEAYGNRWLTPDRFRKWALIRAGFYDETTFICHSKAEAYRFAAYLGSIDGECEVVVQGKLVARRVAKSQAVKAMSKKEFQASKDGVLEVISKLIGVTPSELAKQSGRAA